MGYEPALKETEALLERAGGHHRLTGIDRHPYMSIRPLHDPVLDRQRRPHRALRIILVSHMRAEQRHHRIPNELLHGSAEPL